MAAPTSRAGAEPAGPALELKASTAALTVNDLARSTDFYTRGLGFEVEQRWEDDGKVVGVMLKAGAGWLGLSQDDWAKGKDRVKGVGFRLMLTTDQDVDAIAARAEAAGITLDSRPVDTEWGTRAFSLTDPDGFKLTVMKEL